jgi:thimet oligopeptidase
MTNRVRWSGWCLTWMMALPAASAQDLPGPAFPNIQSAEQLAEQCAQGLEQVRQRLLLLEAHPADAGWLAAYDDFNGLMEDVSGPLVFLSNVHPNAGVRAASEACQAQWQDFSSTLGQNARLYQAAQQVPVLDDIDREAVRQLVAGFEDAGVGLPPARRARVKQLADRIALLGQAFEKRVREDPTRLAYTSAELAGVSPDLLKAAPRDPKGRLLLGLDYPTFFPVMEQATLAATRERMWRAKTNVGGVANMKTLAEIVRLRRELAQQFGYRSYAEFALRHSMAGSVPAVDAFLKQVQARVQKADLADLAEFKAAKAAHLGTPVAQTHLHRWDQQFYSERVRLARYHIDESKFRPYFPPQESLHFVMRLAEKLFGVKYTQVDVPLWHPEAQAYAVTDAATGQALAALMVDMYPREGKYGHAAVAGIRAGALRAGRLPQAVLMVNFDRQGLTLSELRILLHEFGHAVHGNLSTTRYSMQSGTNVERDFVEAPSQMLEDWVQDPKVLALFKEVCPNCQPVPDELVAKARAARNFAKGSQTARQVLYARYDMALHSAAAPDPTATWARMEGATPLGHVQATWWPAAFTHLVGGYAASYYGYQWSLAVALDLRTAFQADRLSADVGRRYRDTVLSQGGQQPPRALLRQFLGRESNSDAYFADLDHAGDPLPPAALTAPTSP